MDIYAFQADAVRPIHHVLVVAVDWLWRQGLRVVLFGMTHEQHSRHQRHRWQHRTRVLQDAIQTWQAKTRAEFGADEAYADELRAMGNDREFGLVLTGDLLDETRVWTDVERADADAFFIETWEMAPWTPDATEIALRAAARQAGGAA